MKKIAYSILAFILISLSVQTVRANEGIVQMKAEDGTPGICEIYSMLLDSFQYKMLVNCRGLKYPISQNLFQYALWADHGEEGVTFLGTLGIGKRETLSPKPFNRLFVTKEASREPTEPSNNPFMSGSVQASAFLEGSGPELAVPTPAPTQAPEAAATTSPTIGGFGQSQTDEQTQGSGLGGAIRILGAVVVFIVVIVIVIAFINASRRRPVSL